MADEFHAGSTLSCWSTIRNSSPFEFSPSISSCSSSILPVELNQTPTGFGFSPMNNEVLLPGLFEPADPLRDMNGSVQPASWASNFSSPQFNSRVSSASNQQMNFSNNAAFWNPSANLAPTKFSEKRFEDESCCSNQTTMKPSETKKQGNDQPASKKQRLATPSPLPTFKVRKEKLGDRITALQQLVSPFGKTDTASVLHEAIEYIKFLHGQALSTPYLKNGHQMQHQKNLENANVEGLEDLRSRGLCLVPISDTFSVASETPLMELWAPTFLGNYM
ncbi:transcription factor bHLH123-like isoform X2 [Asparagus officinalis]|uniref:transcription factor bHLH123-like isoform X2 n=1 Tax=Asparagus officinalis TaxID=4686 RepID=UPI00098E63DE|nr:transcription factor bHLH123-like isoform X2 [Asparagus officinalis]